VVGVSGGGKSSLVRAGLIPALERGEVQEAGTRWSIVVTRPAGAPFANLAADLASRRFDPEGENRNTAITAMQGMGGIGKTVLAQALCHNDMVQYAFPDGTFWFAIGTCAPQNEL